MSMSSARRSARLRRNNSTRGAQEQWGNLSGIWWNQYVDFTQHARRLPICTQRLIDASCEDIDALRSMGISFVALAITTVAARSTSRLGVPSTTENELIVYIQTAALKDLAVNEVYDGYSSVELAAYHGLTNVLTALLTMGCPLKKSSLQANAIFASVRNGKHDSLEIILNTNKEGSARRVIRQEADVIKSTGKFLSTFMETMTKCDVKSALLLLDHDCLEMSDKESKYIFNRNKKFPNMLNNFLTEIYPKLSNVMLWQPELHWSFPTTDRDMICKLYNEPVLPKPLWLEVFTYFPRGWFACRGYDSFGRSGGDIVLRNIIGD